MTLPPLKIRALNRLSNPFISTQYHQHILKKDFCINSCKHLQSRWCTGRMEVSYLEGTRPIRLLPAQIKLTHNREPHKKPVAEAVVVNELEDVLYTQVDQCHDTL